jgi:NIPSNAP
MTARSALTDSVVIVGTLVVGIVIGVAASGSLAIPKVEAAQQGAQPAPGAPAAPTTPPAPCGPKASLPENVSRNVAPDSRCFEIRMYTADRTRDGVGQFKGGINELHQRFREKEVQLFTKHGAQVLGVWQRLDDPDTLVYMLVYRDRAHREQVWDTFGKDPEWDALRRKYFVPLKTNTFFMSAADYSPMK